MYLGAEVDKPAKGGSVAHSIASDCGPTTVVKILLSVGEVNNILLLQQLTYEIFKISRVSTGADVNRTGPGGLTTLIFACGKDKSRVVPLLLEAGRAPIYS